MNGISTQLAGWAQRCFTNHAQATGAKSPIVHFACYVQNQYGQQCVVLMLTSVMQVIDQLVGNLELPWEGSRLTKSVLRKLGAHKKDVLGLLHRDPNERLTLYQFLNSCSRVLAGTESQAPQTQVGHGP